MAGVSVPPLRSPDECSGSRVESADAARSSNTESAALRYSVIAVEYIRNGLNSSRRSNTRNENCCGQPQS